ncbi:DUF2778 domain-containing protein [Ralstonia solanacearum]|uniref:DUF2778 domain-containing protein n=1 Tax=Ralstonia solanacearum TaxID=305 RepID=UPI00078BA28D|nr:DUF2778 domain-containing protein [Ralstonia solanacearum]AMP40290.1 hypothetical protein LBM2029_22375 [Ralstonia solanacearum]AXV89148.1 DUF2778 domain-containing protein [Ralstonia solanacearum]AXW08616.1 DUF2778 domain-containing protein [Ralstonia solanacearum]AXW26398.1 DUF2778 domain-containing protein [Ralstonia solanacearum]AXW83315.1 DUF2778 domain-containing protein [Ralstonia solanacearum]
MPTASCTFTLNGQVTSTLTCDGRTYAAFSGNKGHENKPGDTGIAGQGPLPTGRYYIVDRESGGRLGPLMDSIRSAVSSSNHAEWFALYRDDGVIDDWTFVNSVRRGNFRLHPIGPRGISEGCVTLVSKQQFATLRTYLKSRSGGVVPGTSTKHYGVLEVK